MVRGTTRRRGLRGAAPIALVVLLPLVALVACADPSGSPDDAPVVRIPEEHVATAEDPIEPIPHELDLDARRVELGRRLFHDRRLSGSGERACVDCHDLSAGGIVPGEAQSNHPLNETGPYNVPTVFNVAFEFRLNWNGKFHTLEEHLAGPMMSPNVMDAGGWDALIGRIRGPYESAFVAAGYPDGVTEQSIRSVIATYQRSLITPDSRFDRHLRGEIDLTDDERRGYALFKSVGCITCHQGINVGGNLFQRFGVVEDAFDGRPLTENDMGRYLVTGDEDDAFVFRVASLRNVAITAPYFHDGSAATLEEAVSHMARVQLGYLLDDEEVRLIVAFLHTLTGQLDGRPLAAGEGS